MSALADGDELYPLPPVFEGLAYSVKFDAFVRAEAMLPVNAISAHLGTDYTSNVWSQAAAHVLALDAGLGQGSGWESTSYGQQVARLLGLLPRASGRGRKLPAVV